MPHTLALLRSLIARLALLRLFLVFVPKGILDGSAILRTAQHLHEHRKLPATTHVLAWEFAVLLIFAVLFVHAPVQDHAGPRARKTAEPPPPPQQLAAHQDDENDVPRGPSPYAPACAAKVALVMRLVAASDAADGEWELIVDRGNDVRVWKSRSRAYRYRLQGIVGATPDACYDAVNEVARRHEWDEMTESARVVRELEPGLRLQHVQLRAVWPAAARDLLVISHSVTVASPQPGAPPALVTAGWSVENEAPELRDAVPVRAGTVRMAAECVGLVCCRLPDANNAPRTLMTQIADGDPRGWLPTSLVSLIATKKMPDSFIRVAQLAMRDAQKEKSMFFDATGAPKRTISAAPRQREQQRQQSHNLGDRADAAAIAPRPAPKITLIGAIQRLAQNHFGVTISITAVATFAAIYLVFGHSRRRNSRHPATA